MNLSLASLSPYEWQYLLALRLCPLYAVVLALQDSRCLHSDLTLYWDRPLMLDERVD